ALLLNPSTLVNSEKPPTAQLNSPVVLNTMESTPTAVFSEPEEFSKSAAAPAAVLELPSTLRISDGPRAVLKAPAVFAMSDAQPNAVFPVVVMMPPARALSPCHVLKVGLELQPSRQTACACGESAKQTRMSGMRRNPRHNGSERAGSRPHETNFLTWFNEYMDVFFLFPGGVLVLFCVSLGSEQTKNL